jgi:hypothetical protein
VRRQAYKSSGSHNVKRISSTLHYSSPWQRKSSRKYATVIKKRDPFLLSDTPHFSDKFQRLPQPANRLGILDVNTDSKIRKGIPTDIDSLEVKQNSASHQRSADKAEVNSLNLRKHIHDYEMSDGSTDNKETFDAYKRGKKILAKRLSKMVGTGNEDAVKSTNAEDKYIEADDNDGSEKKDEEYKPEETLADSDEMERENGVGLQRKDHKFKHYSSTQISHRSNQDSIMHIHHDQQAQNSSDYEERPQVSVGEESNDNRNTDDNGDEDYDHSKEEILRNDDINDDGEPAMYQQKDDKVQRSSENEDETEDNKRIENQIHSRINTLKDAVQREIAKEKTMRTKENGEVNSKLEESAQYTNTLARNNDSSDNGDPLRHRSSHAEFNSDARIYRHGSSLRSSTNEDKTKENKRNENQIHSQIDALKDAIRREIAKEEITRTNENGEVKSKLEEPAQYTNTFARNDDSNDDGEPAVYQQKDNEVQRSMRHLSSPAEIKGGVSTYKHGSSFRSSENDDETEDNKRSENQIHSRINALKDAVRREIAKEEITKTNENGEVNSKLEESLQYINTLAGNDGSNYSGEPVVYQQDEVQRVMNQV